MKTAINELRPLPKKGLINGLRIVLRLSTEAGVNSLRLFLTH
jgi:hypothetical protein